MQQNTGIYFLNLHDTKIKTKPKTIYIQTSFQLPIHQETHQFLNLLLYYKLISKTYPMITDFFIVSFFNTLIFLFFSVFLQKYKKRNHSFNDDGYGTRSCFANTWIYAVSQQQGNDSHWHQRPVCLGWPPPCPQRRQPYRTTNDPKHFFYINLSKIVQHNNHLWHCPQTFFVHRKCIEYRRKCKEQY